MHAKLPSMVLHDSRVGQLPIVPLRVVRLMRKRFSWSAPSTKPLRMRKADGNGGFVEASRSLLLLYAGGAVAGPLAASATMRFVSRTFRRESRSGSEADIVHAPFRGLASFCKLLPDSDERHLIAGGGALVGTLGGLVAVSRGRRQRLCAAATSVDRTEAGHTTSKGAACYRAPPPPVVVSNENGSGPRPAANSCSRTRAPMNIAAIP